MSDSKQNMQAFQVLEPERTKTPEEAVFKNKKYEGKWIDPRLLTFCVTNFVINVGVSQIAPFYPDLAANEAGLSYTQIGLVFGINPLGSIIFSLVIGAMLSIWGRKRCLMCALLLQSCVQVLFGCLNFMTGNKGLFLAMSMITRILQGMSRSVYSTVTFAYVPLFWPGEFQKKLGIMETMTALGLLFGPIIGSVLNALFGFSVPFFVIATFFILAEIPIYLQMPPDASLKSFEQKKRLPIGRAFKSVKVVVTIMNVMTITCGYIFFNPFFVNHMAAFGISPNYAALILTVPAVFYITLVNVIPKLQKIVQKTFFMSLSLLICFCGNMIEAPFWGTGNTIAPVVIGLICVGCAQAFSMLPSIPQISEFLAPVINEPELKSGINDMASALFIMSMGFGSLLGPLLGGSVYDAFGGNVSPQESPEMALQEKRAFQHSLEILGLWQFVVGVLFFFFADGYKGWADLFRRCATSKKDDDMSTNLLQGGSEGVQSDNDTTSDGSSEKIVERELTQSPVKTIKIRRENV